MGFLSFIFGGERDLESLRESLKGLTDVIQEVNHKQESLKIENNQLLSVLASFEKDMDLLKEDMDKRGSLSKSDPALEKRLAAVEKASAAIKAIGRLSIQNHDALKSMDDVIKRLDDIEKMLKEHISLTPEIIISKDEYSEEISELRKRLDALESKELIVVGESKKKQRRQ